MNDKDRLIQKLLKKQEEYQAKQRKIFDTLQSRHSHAEVMDWVNCFQCQKRYKESMETRRKMGLEDSSKYLNWKKKNNEDRNIRLRYMQNHYK